MRKISNSEMVIMDILWEYSEPLGSLFIQQECVSLGYQWNISIVLTFLARMKAKGFVDYTSASQAGTGKTHYYYPLISKKEYDQYILSELVSKKLGMDICDLVMCFVEDKLPPEKIAELKEYFKEIKEKNDLVHSD